jgi:hypothetical protein
MAASGIIRIDKRFVLIPVTCDYIHTVDACGGYIIPVHLHGEHSPYKTEFIAKLEALIEEYTGKPTREIAGL